MDKEQKPKKKKILFVRHERSLILDNVRLLTNYIYVGKLQMVQLLVINGADINKPGRHMITPLHAAADSGHLDIMKFLLLNGAYVDPTLEGYKIKGLTPLHLAVKKNHLECVKLLLESGASITPQTEGIFHPIHYAVFCNAVEVTRVLLQHGADANVRFNNKFFQEYEVTINSLLWLDHNLPLLHYSIIKKHHKMAELLKTYVNINSKTNLGKTALMQAVEVNNIDWVEALATNENVNDKDSLGQPVLHFAMINANRKVSFYSKEEFSLYSQRLYVINHLILLGADINARFPENEDHSCIIHYMIKYGFEEGVSYLLYRYCNFNFNQIDNLTLLSGKILRKNLTPDILNDQDYLNKLFGRSRRIMYLIIKKAISFQMIGLPVDQTLILERPFYSEITMEQYTRSIYAHKNIIMRQIDYMKKTKVDCTNITFWDLLTCDMTKLVKFMSNEHIKNLDIHFKCDDNMIYYASILLKRFHTARKIKISLEKMTEQVATSLINCIPFDCCEEIANIVVYNKSDYVK